MLTKEPPHYLWAEALGDHPLVEKPVTDPPRQGHLLQPTRSHLTAGRCRGVFRTRQGPSLQGEWGQSGRWRDPSENQLPAPEGTPAGLGVTGRAPPLTAGFLVCRRDSVCGVSEGPRVVGIGTASRTEKAWHGSRASSKLTNDASLQTTALCLMQGMSAERRDGLFN